MTDFVLTAVDTAGIQSYIYGSNNLQQNIGASYLVKMVTQNWAVEILHGFGIASSVPSDEIAVNLKSQTQINEDSNSKGEIIYAGGGNIVILFREEKTAIEFVKQLSFKALLEAPGLRVVAAHKKGFNWNTDALGGKDGAIVEVLGKLAKSKFSPPPIGQFLGISVTSESAFYSLPSVIKDQEGRRLSAEAKAKLDANEDASKSLKNFLRIEEMTFDFEFPNAFDQFGQVPGESSYIAVVHADGNGMGKRIEKIANQFHTAELNRGYINSIRTFSELLEVQSQLATQNMLKALMQSIKNDQCGGYQITDRVKLNISETGKTLLPIRPIVFGGDDLTIVCNGDLGLSLASIFLKELSSKLLLEEPIHCRAGVAIVKTHYPFSRAYDLAKQLLDSAKERIKEVDAEARATAIDWHYGMTGVVESEIDTIRQKEYSVGQVSVQNNTSERRESANQKKTKRIERKYYREEDKPNLLMRPLLINGNSSEWRVWDNFLSLHKEMMLQSDEKRNKVKKSRVALRIGPEETKNFVSFLEEGDQFFSKLKINGPQDDSYTKTGWLLVPGEIKGTYQLERCVYFDVVEALDHFIDLEEEVAHAQL